MKSFKIDKSLFTGNLGLLIYRIIVLIMAIINFGILYKETITCGVMSLVTSFVYSAADTLIFLIPVIFLRRKYLYFVIAWFLLITVLIYANMLHFRNFGDIISGSSYFASGNFNSFVINGAISSVRFSDILFLFTNLIVISCTIWAAGIKADSDKGFVYGYLAATILFVSGFVFLSVRRCMISDDKTVSGAIEDYMTGYELQVDWTTYLLNYGFSGYFARAMSDNFYTGCDVSDEDIAEIRSLLHNNGNIEEADSLLLARLSGKSGKNLILIIVESLNSKVLELDESDVIAPNMRRWMADSTTLYFPDIEAMTGSGRSSDGQFMVNTGILPLRSEAFVTRYANADYPSLAKSLGYESVEIIGEDKSLWSHYLTTISYGYDRLIDSAVPSDCGLAKKDPAIFAKARSEVEGMSQPFFMQITSIGMHSPYATEPNIKLNLKKSYPDTDRRYFELVNAFDKSCGDFIEYLKQKGIYDNSVIVIVADHEERYPALSKAFNEKRIPMLILNSQLGEKKDYSGKFRQIDIFPTILDVMGIPSANYFRGVGKSMLRRASGNDIPLTDAYIVSEKLIKSKELRDAVNASFIRRKN